MDQFCTQPGNCVGISLFSGIFKFFRAVCQSEGPHRAGRSLQGVGCHCKVGVVGGCVCILDRLQVLPGLMLKGLQNVSQRIAQSCRHVVFVEIGQVQHSVWGIVV